MTAKVLLVDDDANALASYRRGLRDQFEVETAIDGQQGLELLEERGPFAVVVADMRMPGMNGIQFLSQVKERAPDTVRMMLTGYADVETAISAVNTGRLFRFLSKPCPSQELADSIRAGVREYHSVTAEREALSIATDASRGRLSERFLHLQRMEVIGKLAGGVAHDFANLLVAIKGYTGLALEDLPADSPAREWIEEVIVAAESASRLTQRLLDLSRRRGMMSRVINLNDLIGDLVKMLSYLIGDDVELELIPGQDLGLVRADPGLLHQAVVNLAVNGRDAMPNGGTLTVTTWNAKLDGDHARRHLATAPGDYVALSVRDTGTGMTDEVRKHLFEPFFTTKEPGKGTGLGLATVRDIVRQHDGAIEVESEVDVGTTFTIYFPRTENLAEADALA